jgi:UDP-GlcNAc:undecaprenyl-phosphate/decaprenyl-phosphate GlcNAc-1-phosphate transferase
MNAINSALHSFDPTLDPVLHNLGPAVPVFGVALVLAAILCLAAIPLSRPLGLMKQPSRARDIHARATPMLGGIAMFVAFAGAVLLLVPPSMARTAVLVLCGVVAFFFLLDDRFGLPAWFKLVVQAGIALVAILGFGWTFQITFFSLPGIGMIHTGWVAIPLTLFWLLGMQNTVNLIDGVDGLAGGVVAIVALMLMVAAASIGQSEVTLLAAALAGVCLGYLVFNFHPAKLFMADSGAYFLGMALGLLSIMGVAKLTVALALAIPILALAVPIADTAFSIIRRRLEGVSFARADAKHIHHRLLDLGLSQRETCLVFYGATGILGAIGLTVLGHRKILGVAIVIMIVLLSTALADRMQTVGRRIGPSVRALLEKRELR